MSALATLFAVALSISKPGQYRFVAPVETNRLTGVGMGASAPSGDAPLRYEDAAFLAEAFKERKLALGGISAGYTNPVTEISSSIDLSLLASEYREALAYGAPRPLGHGYAKTDAKLLSGISRATNYEANSEDANAVYRHIWLDIFPGLSDPFLSPSVDTTLLKHNMPLSSRTISALYEELGKMRRPCVKCVMTPLGEKYSTVGEEDSNYSSWASEYFSSDNTWSYGTDKSTNVVSETSGNYVFYYDVNLKAGRKKSRGFDYDVDNRTWKDMTGVKNSHYTYKRKWGTYGQVFADCSPALAKLGGRRYRGAKVFGLGYYQTRRNYGSGLQTKEGYFVVEIPVRTSDLDNPQLLVVSIGPGNYNEGIVDQVKKLFSDPGYETGEELLSTVIIPADPQKEHDGYKDTSNEYWFSRTIRIADFYVVFDMDFNARVKGGE